MYKQTTIDKMENGTDKSFPLAAKIINGGVAGIIGVASVFPIDLAKTRLQNQRANSPGGYNSLLDCLQKVIRQEGLLGMYRGSAVNLLLITPEKAIKLTFNDLFRHLLSSERASKAATKQSKVQQQLTIPREMLAGAGAGLCQIVVTTPMELLKIQGQSAGTSSNFAVAADGSPQQGSVRIETAKPSASRIAIELIRQEGLKGLYKGTGATMLRDVTFSAIYFPLFANLRKLGSPNGDASKSSFLVNFVAGCTAGTVASLSVNPADVVKTRLQVIDIRSSNKYLGIGDAFKRIYREEGLKAFMKGAGCRVIYIAPLFGIAQTVYYLGVGEAVMEYIKS